MKIVVGMSGGVDSSVAALLLVRDGHDVTGVTMKIWRGQEAQKVSKGNACYGPDEAHDIEETREICRIVGIPHLVVDCAEQYERIVLDYFKTEYRSGRTPNPCVRCNQEIKFGVLPRLARENGLPYDKFATGHYARVEFDPARSTYRLKTGVEPKKDQSYFLYRLSGAQLASVLFPIGAFKKDEVRRIARDAGLPVHDKEESQDFYSGDYGDLIGCGGAAGGDIVDLSGTVLGRHAGIWNYTIGQRKGLGIAYTEPLYVVRLDPARNRVVVGTEPQTRQRVCSVIDCIWSGTDTGTSSITAQVKIRSSSAPADAIVEPLASSLARVRFAEPQTAITPGQSAVFYNGDTVLGGGIIDRVGEA